MVPHLLFILFFVALVQGTPQDASDGSSGPTSRRCYGLRCGGGGYGYGYGGYNTGNVNTLGNLPSCPAVGGYVQTGYCPGNQGCQANSVCWSGVCCALSTSVSTATTTTTLTPVVTLPQTVACSQLDSFGECFPDGQCGRFFGFLLTCVNGFCCPLTGKKR